MTPSNDPQVLFKSLQNSFSKLHKKMAEKEFLINKEASLVVGILSAKNRLEMKNEVKETLDDLQNKSQEKSIGLFTNLLTAMIHDVQPKNKGEKLHFELSTRNGVPNLDILMDVGDGNVEDVSLGRGGSLTNIISTGLRYVTLSRTRNRRFIVLDEPDCWMNESSVPRFAKVISDISKKVGVQTIGISHKDATLYNSRIIQISRDPETGRAKASVIQESSDDDYITSEEYEEINKTKLMDNVGIKRLTFKNFMSLEDITIELSPTMNMIVGEGDIGKSAIFAGISAFANNKASASMITHGKPEFSIEIEIEDGIVLKMTHKRKGAKKTAYEMILPDGEVISEENGKTVPEFIDEALAIKPVDGINIQLSHQKEPPFMIGSHITSSKRAELLSLGRESDYIQQMVTMYGKQVKDDGAFVRNGEKELKEVRSKIDLLSGLEKTEERLKKVEQELNSSIQEMSEVKTMEGIANELEENAVKMRRLAKLKDVPFPTPYSVQLENQDIINEIVKVGAEIKKNHHTLKMLEQMKNIKIPELEGYQPISEDDKMVYQELVKISKTKYSIQNDIASEKALLEEKNKEIEALIEEFGGVCPLCKQNMPHNAH